MICVTGDTLGRQHGVPGAVWPTLPLQALYGRGSPVTSAAPGNQGIILPAALERSPDVLLSQRSAEARDLQALDAWLLAAQEQRAARHHRRAASESDELRKPLRPCPPSSSRRLRRARGE